LGLGDRGTIRAGALANLILFRARGMTELLARRVILRAGRVIDATPPDYRQLDRFLAC
jgi:cytosine/creatinine deaminase